MKQKYKVFINDKEILFQSDVPSEISNLLILPERLSSDEIFDSVNGTKSEEFSIFLVKSEDPFQQFSQFIQSFRLIEAAGGIVFSNAVDNKLLMIYRLGFWDLPKGKIEKNENIETAAIREVEEECGISDLVIIEKADESFHIYTQKGKKYIKRTHWFLMRTNDKKIPKPQISEGIEKVKWMNSSEVNEILPQCYRLIADLIKKQFLNS